jgi:hypothetical protein
MIANGKILVNMVAQPSKAARSGSASEKQIELGEIDNEPKDTAECV